MMSLTINEIMDRLSRICGNQGCGVKIRPNFPPGPKKWYVELDNVVVAFISGGYRNSITADCDSGETPEKAILNVWNGILALACNQNRALMRYNCPDNGPIPGKEPQVWVRWNEELDDWVDVSVPETRVPADMLRTYEVQRLLDSRC